MLIQKKIAIVEVYCIIGKYNNNVCYLRIIIEPQTYLVEHIYLSNLNFLLDITDLYMYFSTDFVFPKTEKYNCHQFYSIYYSFSLCILYYYIRCQLYPLVSTATYNYINRTMKKRQ